MLSDYPALQLHALASDAHLAQTDLLTTRHIKLNHPAVEVLTDLRTTTAVTVSPETSIETAEKRMRRRGVRLLFVLDMQGGLIGLITATDLMGEKPLKFIQSSGGSHRDIRVRDIMTPRERLETLKLADIAAARVGHIVTTLQQCGRQHALVVDTIDGREQVVGLFSASRIARQLGMEIGIVPVARTFAEIEKELAH